MGAVFGSDRGVAEVDQRSAAPDGVCALSAEVVLVRHGFAERGADGDLTRYGRDQVAALAAELVGRGIHPSVVMCSPARRCVQSAGVLGAAFGIDVSEDRGLTVGSASKLAVAIGALARSTVLVTHEDVILNMLDILSPETEGVRVAPRASAWMLRPIDDGWLGWLVLCPV